MNRYFENSYVKTLEKYIGVTRYLLIILAICYAVIKLYNCYKAYKGESYKKIFLKLNNVLLYLIGEFCFLWGYYYMLTTFLTADDLFAPTISAIVTSIGAVLLPLSVCSLCTHEIDKIINKNK